MNRQDTLIILSIACFVVFVWIMLNVYHAANTSTISDSILGQVVSIQPSFDQAVINSIKNRTSVDPVYQMSAVSNSASNSAAPVSNTPSSLTP